MAVAAVVVGQGRDEHLDRGGVGDALAGVPQAGGAVGDVRVSPEQGLGGLVRVSPGRRGNASGVQDAAASVVMSGPP